MKIDKINNYYSNQIVYDLYKKFYFVNLYNIPKVTTTKFYINNLQLKPKIFLVFVFYIFLVLNQTFAVKLTKGDKKKFKINKIFLHLNSVNQNIFLDNLINFYLPNIQNFKKLPSGLLFNGNLTFKLNNILSFTKLRFNLENLNLKKNITIKLKSSTKNNFLAYTLFSLYLIPIDF